MGRGKPRSWLPNAPPQPKVPYFRGMKWKTPAVILCKLLFISLLLTGDCPNGFSQSIAITPKKLTLLTGNIDSLLRSYLKKGFILTSGSRDAETVLSDKIYLEDGFELELESPFLRNGNSWYRSAIKQYGAHTSGLAFETENPDSLFKLFQLNEIPCVPLVQNDSTYLIESFAIDSCRPLDVVFERTHRQKRSDPSATHKNHVYRLDWVLLSAGKRMEEIFRKIFSLCSDWQLHGGCCDYWRVGSPDDFTFFRFEPLPQKTTSDPYWLSIEPDNFYWAY